MATKTQTIVLDDFQQRFIKILESQNAKYWMITLGIQGNLLWGWKKGNYPGLRYAIEICLNEGISANWLFLDVGPQYTEDLESIDEGVLLDKSVKEEILTTILKLKKEMKKERRKRDKKLNEIVSETETMEALKTFSESFSSIKDFDALINSLPSSIQEKLMIPIFNFLEKNANEITDSALEFGSTEEGAELIKNMVRWVIDRK